MSRGRAPACREDPFPSSSVADTAALILATSSYVAMINNLSPSSSKRAAKHFFSVFEELEVLLQDIRRFIHTLVLAKIAVSSANVATRRSCRLIRAISFAVGMSCVKRLYSVGPKTLPCKALNDALELRIVIFLKRRPACHTLSKAC